MSWAGRRQVTYVGGLLLFIGVVLFVIFYSVIFKAPTCSDGKKNNGELGVDCGGSCELMCSSQVSDPVVLWSRSFPVAGSAYNLLAYVENQNKSAGIREVSYEFKIYDTKNLLIGRRLGKTFIPPNQRVAIFEPRFDTGNAIPRSVTFEFTSPFVWVKKEPTIQTLPIRIDRISYGEDASAPTLTARMVNDSIYDLPAFDVVTILYNTEHNAISVSKTHKDNLLSNETTPLLFTWPRPFSEKPVTQDILPVINPFTTSF